MPIFRIRLYFQQKMFSGDEWVKSCRQYSISFYSDSWMDETTVRFTHCNFTFWTVYQRSTQNILGFLNHNLKSLDILIIYFL